MNKLVDDIKNFYNQADKKDMIAAQSYVDKIAVPALRVVAARREKYLQIIRPNTDDFSLDTSTWNYVAAILREGGLTVQFPNRDSGATIHISGWAS